MKHRVRLLLAVSLLAAIFLITAFGYAQYTNTPSAETLPTQRILFIGDSRTIDMFADSDEELTGIAADGITVYAKHGHGYDYMASVINTYGLDNFDVLVSWMGANDHGHFEEYGPFYDGILSSGKTLILCTVGPTADEFLGGEDAPFYKNKRMIRFNTDLLQYAEAHNVQVIDLYSYILSNVTIDPADGIHYLPRPTTAVWEYIKTSLVQ